MAFHKFKRERILAFDKGSARTVDAQGFLHVEACNISKACVNPYWGSEIPDCEELGLDPKKVYKLFRDPAELEKGADTFNNLPLMDYHVEVSAFDLEDDKIKKKIVGSTGTRAKFVGPYLQNDLVVWTASGIEGVMTKEQTQLSSAYRYKLDMTPGEFEGEAYDGRMYDLIGNHVALVDEGRAGPDVTVKDRKHQSLAKIVAQAMQGTPLTAMDKVRMALGLEPRKEDEGAPYEIAEAEAQAAGKAAEENPNQESFKKASELYEIAAQAHKAAGFSSQASYHHRMSKYYGIRAARAKSAVSQDTSVYRPTMRSQKKAGETDARRIASLVRLSMLSADAGLRALKDSAAPAGKHDLDILEDVIENIPDHKDSNGKPAPWVIKSEKSEKILWSGSSKEEAVKNLERVKSFAKDSVVEDEKYSAAARKDSVTAEEAEDETHGHFPGEYTSAHSTAASKEANSKSDAARGKGEAAHRQASAAHHKAVVTHQAAANSAQARGLHEQAHQHHQAIQEHRDMVAHHEQMARRSAALGKDSVVAVEDETHGHYPGEFGGAKGSGQTAAGNANAASASASRASQKATGSITHGIASKEHAKAVETHAKAALSAKNNRDKAKHERLAKYHTEKQQFHEKQATSTR